MQIILYKGLSVKNARLKLQELLTLDSRNIETLFYILKVFSIDNYRLLISLLCIRRRTLQEESTTFVKNAHCKYSEQCCTTTIIREFCGSLSRDNPLNRSAIRRLQLTLFKEQI